MIIDHKQISNKKYYTTYCNEVDYNMYDFIRYSDNHPKEYKQFIDHRKRLLLTAMEIRPSTPYFAKKIIKKLKNTFYKNEISLQAFVGFTNDSESHSIHRDAMDVLYLQVIGNINWSIWESNSSEDAIEPDEGFCIFKKTLVPGDMIWIPRGTFHFIEPLTPRVGFSFGVEGTTDPCTYIK